MKQVRISDQVLDFLRHLPPEPKARVRAALRDLSDLKGDIRELEHPLDGFCRLRVHQFRVILRIHSTQVDCIFIERRSIVYEIFESMVLD
ncbi:MAG: hypothetical protein LR015_10920 [Verrucomicrobia bacterium]|nr:hypothetical protein [Verrucomicrobiota bacterium]